MEPATEQVIVFLESLQDRMAQLCDVWSVYTDAGARPGRPHLTLSARPFTVHGDPPARYRGSVALGLIVEGLDGREYDIGVDLLWSDGAWVIETEAYVANEAGGQDLVRKLPTRSASDLGTCLRELEAAIADLAGFTDVVCDRGGA